MNADISQQNIGVSPKQLIISSITALVCGVVFIVAIPILCLFVLDAFVTFVSLLDPLHQGKNIDAVWGAFVWIVIIQTIVACLASVASGVAVSFLTAKIKTGWVYFLGMAVCFGIYCFFQLLSVMSVGLFAEELIVVSWLFISMLVVACCSIIVGLILVGVNRKLSR